MLRLKTKKMYLKRFEKNVKSQFGEDGVVGEIFRRIGTTNRKCVEFGAWDGLHYSNTWNLWEGKNWEALLIEADPDKYDVLVRNLADFKNVKALNALVSSEGKDSLENILRRFDYPLDLDLLSVDIDGDDYYIMESLTSYRPRLIIIEYNPTIPANIELIQVKGEYFGSSALSLLRLAHSKSYKLAHLTDTNMFFVSENDFANIGFHEPSLGDIFNDKYLSYVISSYGGSLFVVGDSPYGELERREMSSKHPKVINVNDIKFEKSVIYKL